MAGRKPLKKEIIPDKEVKTEVEEVDTSQADLEAAVEKYLGVHPKYFVYEAIGLRVDIWTLEHDGKHFNGFLPHLKELGQI